MCDVMRQHVRPPLGLLLSCHTAILFKIVKIYNSRDLAITGACVGQDKGHHEDLLEDHIQELTIAKQNRFMPILMVPEAVQYQQEQKRINLQLRQKRKHQPGVIRAPVPANDHIAQRELLSSNDEAQNATHVVPPAHPPKQPNIATIVYYTVAHMLLDVWYWLPTRLEILLWISQYLPVADVLCMDYYRLVLGNRTPHIILDDIPLTALDQALHDAWLHG